MTGIKLYIDANHFSPYAYSAFVALKEKGLPFEVRAFDLGAGAHKKDVTFMAGSPTGKIPTIDDGGFWLAESSAIAEYLDEKYPAPTYKRLLPRDVEERATARMVMAWVRSEVPHLRRERPTSSMFFAEDKRTGNALGDAAYRDAEQLIAFAGKMVPEGKTQMFLEWSIADADLGFMLMRLVANGHEVPKRLKAFAEAQWNRPTAQDFIKAKRPAFKA